MAATLQRIATTRYYSKNGCLPCKRRKKKCDETPLRCLNCHRLDLRCSYSETNVGKTGAVRKLGTFELNLPSIPRHIETVKYGDDVEKASMHRAVDIFLARHGPRSRDFGLLWHMIVEDDLVRSAVVACFSVIYGDIPQCGQLHRIRYGKTLRLLGAKINSLGQAEIKECLGTLVALVSLGMLDSVKPMTGDLHTHWKAVLTLLTIKRPPIKMIEELSREKTNILLMCCEVTSYFVLHYGIFSQDIESLSRLWASSRILEILESIVSHEPTRITISPWLQGQYTFHAMVLEVTWLLRSSSNVVTPRSTIDEMQLELCKARASMQAALEDDKCLEEQVKSISSRANLLTSNSLQMCLYYLEPYSVQRRPAVDLLVSESLKEFEDLDKEVSDRSFTYWALIILGCSIDDDVEWMRYVTRMKDDLLRMARGHATRMQKVVELLEKLRSNPEGIFPCQSEDMDLPLGVTLLRKQGGILSEEGGVMSSQSEID